MIRTTFVAVAAVLAAGPVLAAPADGGIAFNGPFIGVQGGWQQDRQRLATLTNGGFADYSGRDGSGFGYGGQIGYDYRLQSNLVLGGEVSVTGRTGDDGLIDGYGNAYDLRLGRTIDATGRLGLVFPQTGGLGYFRGGYSNARFDLSDAVARQGYNRDGYVVGVGYEQPIARHVSARFEYDYSDYGRNRASATAVDDGFYDARTRNRRNAVSAGLDFHF